jgi:hypothetical protein
MFAHHERRIADEYTHVAGTGISIVTAKLMQACTRLRLT